MGCAEALASLLTIRRTYRFTEPEMRHWLESRPYTTSRKNILLASLDKYRSGDHLDLEAALKPRPIKAFIKNEPYAYRTPKAPRLICNRDDVTKVVLGPLF